MADITGFQRSRLSVMSSCPSHSFSFPRNSAGKRDGGVTLARRGIGNRGSPLKSFSRCGGEPGLSSSDAGFETQVMGSLGDPGVGADPRIKLSVRKIPGGVA